MRISPPPSTERGSLIHRSPAMVETPKLFCKDCTYFREYLGGPMPPILGCAASQRPEKVDPVYGRRPLSQASMMRANPEYCGMEAKWYAQRVKPLSMWQRVANLFLWIK